MMHGLSNIHQILESETRYSHSDETIQKRFGKPFASTSLVDWVLGTKQPKTLSTLNDGIKLWNEYFSPVIQERI